MPKMSNCLTWSKFNRWLANSRSCAITSSDRARFSTRISRSSNSIFRLRTKRSTTQMIWRWITKTRFSLFRRGLVSLKKNSQIASVNTKRPVRCCKSLIVRLKITKKSTLIFKHKLMRFCLKTNPTMLRQTIKTCKKSRNKNAIWSSFKATSRPSQKATKICRFKSCNSHSITKN